MVRWSNVFSMSRKPRNAPLPLAGAAALLLFSPLAGERRMGVPIEPAHLPALVAPTKVGVQLEVSERMMDSLSSQTKSNTVGGIVLLPLDVLLYIGRGRQAHRMSKRLEF